MIKLLQQLNITDFALGVLTVFLMSLGTVYIFGRLLEIVKYWRTKNIIALISSGTYSYFFVKTFREFINEQFIFVVTLYSLSSVILYVLVGFRLYDRVDKLLDKKIGKDKPFRKKK
jgi:hypothetical protein